MNLPIILSFLKSILPTKKIGAWILGLIAALMAGFLSVKNSDLKAEFCKAEPVEIVGPVVPAAPVVPESK